MNENDVIIDVKDLHSNRPSAARSWSTDTI